MFISKIYPAMFESPRPISCKVKVRQQYLNAADGYEKNGKTSYRGSIKN